MKRDLILAIERFVEEFQANSDIRTRWGKPIVGVGSSADPLFGELRVVASPTHAVPADFLPQTKSVIAFFLPFPKSLSSTNIHERNGSREWGIAYVETNELIRRLSLFLEEFFVAKGEKSFRIPATHNWDKDRLISDWSHRHIAYIAGVGNFGLNNMLITDQGCCGRIGSFLTSAEMEPDPRRDQPACLFKHDGSCKKCVKRCVNEALYADSFNRFKCYDMCLENAEQLETIGYADVCGKCLVAVPCSHENPVARKLTAGQKST